MNRNSSETVDLVISPATASPEFSQDKYKDEILRLS